MEMKDHNIYVENKDEALANGDSCSEQSKSSSEWEDDYGRQKSMFEWDCAIQSANIQAERTNRRILPSTHRMSGLL
jgi:hypothetical protein